MTHDDSLTFAYSSAAASPIDVVEDGGIDNAFQPLPRRRTRPRKRRNPILWALLFGAAVAGISLLISASDHAFAQKEQAPSAAQPVLNCDQ